jgi:hypothetical protein
MEQRIELANELSSDVTLIIEPWAEEFTMKPGQTLTLIIYAENQGALTIAIIDGYHVIYLWSGSTASVLIDEVDVSQDLLSLPAP